MGYTKVMKYWTDESDPIFAGASKAWNQLQLDFCIPRGQNIAISCIITEVDC